MTKPCDLRIRLLQLPGNQKRDEREPLSYWIYVQAEKSLCWSHRSYCRFCSVLAESYLIISYEMR